MKKVSKNKFANKSKTENVKSARYVKTLSAIRVRYKSKRKSAVKLVMRAVQQWQLDPISLKVINCLMGKNGAMRIISLADYCAIEELQKIFMDLMGKHLAGATPTRRYYSLTFIDDDGLTSDREPVFLFGDMAKRITGAVRRMKLNAVVVLETHPIMNYPQAGAGRSFTLHGHAVGWTDDPFDHEAEQDALNSGRTWQSKLGALPVKIVPLSEGPFEIEDLAAYLFKHPNSAKNVMPNQKKPGQLLMMDTTEGFTPELALRLFECRSQTPLAKAIFGLNGGMQIKSELLKRLGDWHRGRLRDLGSATMTGQFSIAKFWKELRQTHGSKNFKPMVFVGLPDRGSKLVRKARPPLFGKARRPNRHTLISPSMSVAANDTAL